MFSSTKSLFANNLFSNPPPASSKPPSSFLGLNPFPSFINGMSSWMFGQGPWQTVFLSLVGIFFTKYLLRVVGISLRLKSTHQAKPVRKDISQAMWAGNMPKEAQEILNIFRHPEIYERFATPIPKGVLLVGPPGTGKTYFARILSELVPNCRFFETTAAQFDEIYVGRGPQRIRSLFNSAIASTQPRPSGFGGFFGKESEPVQRAIIFIDELDAIGSRSSGSGFRDPTHATVSQLLSCMDGIVPNNGILIIATTNNLGQVDEALRRSGRFDRIIEMPLPSQESRLELLKFYLANRNVLVSDNELDKYAFKTEGFSCADMKTMVNEAVLDAVNENIMLKERNEMLYSSKSPSISSTTSSPRRSMSDITTNGHGTNGRSDGVKNGHTSTNGNGFHNTTNGDGNGKTTNGTTNGNGFHKTTNGNGFHKTTNGDGKTTNGTTNGNGFHKTTSGTSSNSTINEDTNEDGIDLTSDDVTSISDDSDEFGDAMSDEDLECAITSKHLEAGFKIVEKNKKQQQESDPSSVPFPFNFKFPTKIQANC